jgi:hypothetical protein
MNDQEHKPKHEHKSSQDTAHAPTKPKIAASVPWIRSERGVCEIYANSIHVNWTTYDVRLRFGQLLADPEKSPDVAGWVVDDRAAITLSWNEAKYLRNLLHGLIKDYEAKNGKLVIPQMPAPEQAEEP